MKLKLFFAGVFILSVSFLVSNLLKEDPKIDVSTIRKLEAKSRYLDDVIKRKYFVHLHMPIYIKEIPRSVWGYTLYDGNGPLAIYLNASVLRDNPNYVINHVLAHELAHAVEKAIYKRKNRSHGKEWHEICQNISDGNCDRFVNDQFVVKEKIFSFFNRE